MNKSRFINNIQYYSHKLLHSKYKIFINLTIFIVLYSSFNSTSLYEVDCENIIKEEATKEYNKKSFGITLFILSILFSVYVSPFVSDGTALYEQLIEVLNYYPFIETTRPMTQREMIEYCEQILRKEMGYDKLSDAEIYELFCGKKKK